MTQTLGRTFGVDVLMLTTLLGVLASGCSVDEGESLDATVADTSPAQDSSDDSLMRDAVSVVDEVEGTLVRFDFEVDVQSPEGFYAQPLPSDLRLTEDGYPDLRGFPNPNALPLVEPLLRTASQRRGWPQLPVAWFQFDGPVASERQGVVFTDEPDAPLMLVDVDPDSPERGKRFPLAYRILDPDPFTAEHTLALSPVAGIILRPERTYAFVVMRSLNDAEGDPLGVPVEMVQLRMGQAPSGPLGERAVEVFAPLWETLDGLGVSTDEVAAATVFTTGDVVKDLSVMSDALVSRDRAEFGEFQVDPNDGDEHARYCELVGELTVPQYQVGTPPFDADGGFELGADGLPTVQRMETVPVTLTLPLTEMPIGGYPLVTYIHGSGGKSTQLVDRGPVLEVGGTPQKGLGPAHVLAHHGFAAIGSALPLNPERLEGAGDYDYINVANPGVFPYTFQQGLLEQRLMFDALSDLEIGSAVVAACSGLALPDGEDVYRVRVEPGFVMGQSMGGVYTNMLAATEPMITAVVPTGAGGFWSWFVLFTDLVDAPPLLALLFETDAELTHHHPMMHLAQLAWEGAEPLVFMSRISRAPLQGHPRRDVYEPVGLGDSYFPYPVFDAASLAYGNQQAGDLVWPSMQLSLSYAGLDGMLDYPVSENRVWPGGTTTTNVVVQYEGDGIYDPHAIFAQLDAVKFQYGCFFETARDEGRGRVLAPKALGESCD